MWYRGNWHMCVAPTVLRVFNNNNNNNNIIIINNNNKIIIIIKSLTPKSTPPTNDKYSNLKA